MSTHTRHPDAVTEHVTADAFRTYRRNARRMGLVIVMSSPAGSGGFYVTTAARRTGGTR